MTDPAKEPQGPKTDELSTDELDAVTGGGAIVRGQTKAIPNDSANADIVGGALTAGKPAVPWS